MCLFQRAVRLDTEGSCRSAWAPGYQVKGTFEATTWTVIVCICRWNGILSIIIRRRMGNARGCYTLVLRDTIMRNCYTCPVEQGRLFMSRPLTVIVHERVDVASRWRRLFPATNLNYNCF